MMSPVRTTRPLSFGPRTLPIPLVEQRLNRAAFVLLVAWTLATLWVPLMDASVGVVPGAWPFGSAQPIHNHAFADDRTFWGLANGVDVLSNLPFVLGGLWGFWTLRQASPPPAAQAALRVFFAGLLFTGAGSAWYHLAPDGGSLVLDRVGMAVAFAGALALAVSERVGACPSRITLWLTLVLALLSAVMPHSHGNVLPWAVVQFGGMVLLAWLALQKPVAGAIGVRLGVLIAWYALAKVLEGADASIFQATGEAVSGHSLKHMVAALAVWPVVRAVRQNARAKAVAPAARPGAQASH